MTDVYARLAKKLDRLPHGFPPTRSGVEIRILQKVFTPADAWIAVKLGIVPKPAERIARQLGLPVEVAIATLNRMAARGQILSFTSNGVQHYGLAPFIIGIYEFQVNHLDAEFAELFERYAPDLLRRVGGHAPALGRVVPVGIAIDPAPQVLAYEDLRAMIGEAKSFALRACICRKERALQGHPCTHTSETCLGLSSEPDAYAYFNYAGRVISRDEALRVLDATEQEGLVHVTYNVRRHSSFVCNCCACCCGFLRALKEFEAPYALARSSVVSAIDPVACDGCGACAAARCPMDAIGTTACGYEVTASRCIGCGVCVVACPRGAIALAPRTDPDRREPPPNIAHWYVERTASRTGPLARMVLKSWLAFDHWRTAARANHAH